MRTRVYNAILKQLSDGRWHWLADIAQVTSYPEHWVRYLARDPRFEIDASKAMIRLRHSLPNDLIPN
jgi:hypothetical protein